MTTQFEQYQVDSPYYYTGATCLRCGKLLNADKGHPAEIYAGTYNGLCYGCTAAGPYVVKVSLLDGARILSWPPACPSWRRDRESYTSYPGCEACKGSGVQGRGRSIGGGTYREYCRPCIDRYCSHPVRQLDARWRAVLREAAESAYQRRKTLAAGLKPTASRKRQREAWGTLGEDVLAALRAEIRPRYDRLLAYHEARIARLDTWRQPTEAELATVERAA